MRFNSPVQRSGVAEAVPADLLMPFLGTVCLDTNTVKAGKLDFLGTGDRGRSSSQVESSTGFQHGY